MKTTSLTQLREKTKFYFDAVEAGETVRVLRHGKPVADVVPVVSHARTASWKRRGRPLKIKGVSLSSAILAERRKSK